VSDPIGFELSGDSNLSEQGGEAAGIAAVPSNDESAHEALDEPAARTGKSGRLGSNRGRTVGVVACALAIAGILIGLQLRGPGGSDDANEADSEEPSPATADGDSSGTASSTATSFWTTHTGSAWSVAWSPDGSMLVSGGQDGTVRLWDTRSGVQVGQPLTGRTGSVQSVAWSPDGTRVASADVAGRVFLWPGGDL
jgi:hypothetical protein